MDESEALHHPSSSELRGVIWLMELRDTDGSSTYLSRYVSTFQWLVLEHGSKVGSGVRSETLYCPTNWYAQRELRGTVVAVVEPLIGQHEISFATQDPHTSTKENGLRTSGEETGSM